MNHAACITIVPADRLDECPPAFREYVRKHFDEQEILGKKCFVAFGAPALSHAYTKKGVAPSHSVDLMPYVAGLNGRSLNVWMDEGEDEGLLWRFRASWNDGCGQPIDE